MIGAPLWPSCVFSILFRFNILSSFAHVFLLCRLSLIVCKSHLPSLVRSMRLHDICNSFPLSVLYGLLDHRMARNGKRRFFRYKAEKDNLVTSMAICQRGSLLLLMISSVHYEEFNKRLDGRLHPIILRPRFSRPCRMGSRLSSGSHPRSRMASTRSPLKEVPETSRSPQIRNPSQIDCWAETSSNVHDIT